MRKQQLLLPIRLPAAARSTSGALRIRLNRFHSTMPRFNAASQEAIARLRNYSPPPTSYNDVPLSRRAAVLILLYADRNGDLKVVITMRAKTLSSYAGDAALPGGRADTLSETAFQTARREAWEEIGLPETSTLPSPFSVEHLCELPANLAKTELVVRPCVALLHSFDSTTGQTADPEVSLIPKLDAREVAAVFTAPFHQFLRAEGEDPGEWYRGSWSRWHSSNWRMHQFFVRASNHKPQQAQQAQAQQYRVFGMTARILVDAARVAYAEEPQFEHNSHFGDEAMIANLRKLGRLGAVRRATDELTLETMEKAAKLS